MKTKLTAELKRIMSDRFGKDSIIALATISDDTPYVRNVDGYYEDGAFYVITYSLSDKMKHIESNNKVAISGEWFTAHGIGENIGYIYKEENMNIAEKLKTAFAEWWDNGHNDYNDPNTCILRIRLTNGVLFSQAKRYEIDFINER